MSGKIDPNYFDIKDFFQNYSKNSASAKEISLQETPIEKAGTDDTSVISDDAMEEMDGNSIAANAANDGMKIPNENRAELLKELKKEYPLNSYEKNMLNKLDEKAEEEYYFLKGEFYRANDSILNHYPENNRCNERSGLLHQYLDEFSKKNDFSCFNIDTLVQDRYHNTVMVSPKEEAYKDGEFPGEDKTRYSLWRENGAKTNQKEKAFIDDAMIFEISGSSSHLSHALISAQGIITGKSPHSPEHMSFEKCFDSIATNPFRKDNLEKGHYRLTEPGGKFEMDKFLKERKDLYLDNRPSNDNKSMEKLLEDMKDVPLEYQNLKNPAFPHPRPGPSPA